MRDRDAGADCQDGPDVGGSPPAELDRAGERRLQLFQVAGGANLICFTTGRGSAYGCAPAPSLKLATNTALWIRQEEDIDINCGEIVDGSASIDEMGERIFRLMLDTASGAKTKSELHGYGQSEFVPWQLGAVM